MPCHNLCNRWLLNVADTCSFVQAVHHGQSSGSQVLIYVPRSASRMSSQSFKKSSLVLSGQRVKDTPMNRCFASCLGIRQRNQAQHHRSPPPWHKSESSQTKRRRFLLLEVELQRELHGKVLWILHVAATQFSGTMADSARHVFHSNVVLSSTRPSPPQSVASTTPEEGLSLQGHPLHETLYLE